MSWCPLRQLPKRRPRHCHHHPVQKGNSSYRDNAGAAARRTDSKDVETQPPSQRPSQYAKCPDFGRAAECGRRHRINSSFALLGAARGLSAAFHCSTLDLSFLNMESSSTVTLTEANFETEVTKSDQPVLVDFWAEWCGPCKMIAPILDEIAKEKAGAVKVAKVNVDDNQSLSARFNIRAIPSLLLFKNGQVRDQVTGMTSKKNLLDKLEALA